MLNRSESGTTWVNNNGVFSSTDGQRVIVDPNGNVSNFADDWYAAVDGNLVMTNGTDYQVWNPDKGIYEKGRAPRQYLGSRRRRMTSFPLDIQIGDTYEQFLYDPYEVLFGAGSWVGDSRLLRYMGEDIWAIEKDFVSGESRIFAANFLPVGRGLKWGGKIFNWVTKYTLAKIIAKSNKLVRHLRKIHGGNVTVMKNGNPIFRVHQPGTHGHVNATITLFKKGTNPKNNRTFNIPDKKVSSFNQDSFRILQKASKGKDGYSLKTRNR